MSPFDDECRALTRYLTGQPPDPYVLASYGRARAFAPATPPAVIDRALWWAARTSPATARLADAYARWFRPAGPLRRRLTLLIAVLENAPATHSWFNTSETGSNLTITLRLIGGLTLSGGLFAIGVAGFGPIHLATAWIRPPADGPSA